MDPTAVLTIKMLHPLNNRLFNIIDESGRGLCASYIEINKSLGNSCREHTSSDLLEWTENLSVVEAFRAIPAKSPK